MYEKDRTSRFEKEKNSLYHHKFVDSPLVNAEPFFAHNF